MSDVDNISTIAMFPQEHVTDDDILQQKKVVIKRKKRV